MLQVHVVTAANRTAYEDEMEVFFQWRYRIYVEEKHWMPPKPTGLETDQFDTDDATYLLAFRDAEFVAGSRLRPFSTPTLLGEVFPHLVAKPMPSGPTEAEWTRMFVVPTARGRGRRSVASSMCCAVMEYCLDAGVSRLGGIQETYWLPRWTDFGWQVSPLGLPQDVNGQSCIAAMFDVTPRALSAARRAAGIEGNQILHFGPHRDFVTAPKQQRIPLQPPVRSRIDGLPKVLS